MFEAFSSILPVDFFADSDVVAVSQRLLGKYLVTHFDGHRTVGKIVETEAYRALDDKACHAYGNRRTPRTEVMFATGGVAYVYLCYGIHHLFNIVTGKEGEANAVLVRGLEPVEGLEVMLERRKMAMLKPRLTAGPGVLSEAMGIQTRHSGLALTDSQSPIWIEDRGHTTSPEAIIASPRVGVRYAEECAHWPWRFRVKDNRWTSPANPIYSI
jgi:DNA-3-methyladenine glycosylase